DVEAAHAVLSGTRRPGELLCCCPTLALGCRLGIALDDGCLDQRLEAAPRDAAIRELRDPGVNQCGLLHRQLAGRAGDVASMAHADFALVQPSLQLRQPEAE